jgi:hypothetical protein
MSMYGKLKKLQERRSDNDYYIGFASTEDSIRSSILSESMLKAELKKINRVNGTF